MIPKKFMNAIHIGIVAFLSIIGTFFLAFLTKGTLSLAGNEFFLYQKNTFPPTDKIVIVRVDNASLDALQKTDLRVLNLTKSVFFELIEKLETDGARAIGFDIVFANDSPDKEVLQQALLRYPNVVIGAKIGIHGTSEQVLPLDLYSGATWGMIDIPKYGSTISRMYPYGKLGDTTIESLSIALFRKYSGAKVSGKGITNTIYPLTPLFSVPLSDGMMLIPFFKEAGEYPSYSLIDVLNDRTKVGTFSGKIVLVGEHGTLIHDAFRAPIQRDKDMPGVEFHANMLDGILSNISLEEKNTTIIAIIYIVILSIFFYLLRIGASAVFLIITLIGSLIVFRWIFVSWGFFYDFMLILEGIVITFLFSNLYRYFVSEKEKRFISHAFSHYIAPEVVKILSENPQNLKLGGDTKKLAVLFSDIAGFTTLSETLGTERLFQVISEYLSEMTDILTEHSGTLDKYIGDAVMGFFGAPLDLPDSSLRACRVALKQQSRLKELMERWKQEGIPSFHARIGIHTGEAMVGNIGSKNRFNYTVMGDTVNLASRLEGVNKEYGTTICVSEAVFLEVNKEFDFRELDTIRVKGKTEGIKIFELLGEVGNKKPHHTTYEDGMRKYYLGEYEKALKLFESIKDIDSPAHTLLERCRYLIENNQRLDDGIWTMTTK